MRDFEDAAWKMDMEENPFEEEVCEDTEEKLRAEHEASEAKRKAEWEARQREKKTAAEKEAARIAAMNEEELMEASMKRVQADVEKLTRRNMKECVSEQIQTLCLSDPAFSRLVMNPRKTMIRCFQYINRKAYDYVQDEMKVNGKMQGNGMSVYACDIPDDLCYQWAEDYFRDTNAKEDQEEEEKFVPKPYAGKASKGKTKPDAKKAEKKQVEKKKEPAKDNGQMTFLNQLSFADMEVKAG